MNPKQTDMRAIVINKFGPAEVLEYETLPDPVPEADQVLIQTRGASVNFADIKARSGSYHLGKKPPFSPGLDIAGVVLEVGNQVTDIKPGDHVIAFPIAGSYVEKAVANQDLTFAIPQSVDLTKAAAAVLVAGTATHMLKHGARIRRNESLLVHAAAGGVGTAALQVARALGITKVFGSIGSPWKESHVKSMGAIGVVDYNSPDYAEEIIEITDNKGVDVILNPLGAETIERDLECLAPFGRLVSFGELKDGISTVPQGGLYTANKTIIGLSFGHFRNNRPDSVRETMSSVIDMLVNEQIDVDVSSCIPLERAAEAHRVLEERKTTGKIVLVP